MYKKISDPVQGGQKQKIINNISKDYFGNIFKMHQFLEIKNTYFFNFYTAQKIRRKYPKIRIIPILYTVQYHIRLLYCICILYLNNTHRSVRYASADS